MMKNGIYFIVIALLVADLFKILVHANYMVCDVTMWRQCVDTKGCQITKN